MALIAVWIAIQGSQPRRYPRQWRRRCEVGTYSGDAVAGVLDIGVLLDDLEGIGVAAAQVESIASETGIHARRFGSLVELDARLSHTG